MINADELIHTCNSLTRHYDKDDPMRWPFLVGILETKIRELVTIINRSEEHTSELQSPMSRMPSSA